MELRIGVVALLAILLQALALFGPFGDDDTPRRVLLVASYLELLVFTAVNGRRLGIAIIGIGVLLNFVPIAANGGLMPVTPETLLRSGVSIETVESWDLNHHVPNSKDVLKERGDVNLYFLADRLVWDDISPPIRAFSIGDVVIAAGLAITMGDLLLPRARRSPGDGRNERGDGAEEDLAT